MPNKIINSINKLFLNQYVINGWAAVLGALTVLAFAPFNYFPLSIIAPALLLQLWLTIKPLQAFIRGWFYGVGFYGLGVSWVYISIHRYGNTSAPLAILLTSLFVMSLALLPALHGFCFTRLFSKAKPYSVLLAFPASWVLFEWVRSWIFTGFPWLLLGDSQTNSPLAAFTPIVGEFGVSFIVVFIGTLALILSRCHPKEHQARRGIFSSMLIIITIFLGIWITAFALKNKQWTNPIGNPIKVAMVQGNVPQELKWSPEYRTTILNLYPKLTDNYWNNDIIIWPEGAIPLESHHARDYINYVDATAKQHHAVLITGIPTAVDHSFKFYNSILMLGESQGAYYKRHLVPFGEYVPLENILRGLIGFFDIPMSDFIPGPWEQPLLKAKDIKLAVFICYEIAYSNIVWHDLPQAQLLITLSDDAWFGDSFAPAQHLQIAISRAQQTGRYLLFSGNNGITAIISPQGKITASVPQFIETVLTGTVYAMQGSTPWVRIGNTPVLIIIFLLLIVSYILRLPSPHHPPNK